MDLCSASKHQNPSVTIIYKAMTSQHLTNHTLSPSCCYIKIKSHSNRFWCESDYLHRELPLVPSQRNMAAALKLSYTRVQRIISDIRAHMDPRRRVDNFTSVTTRGSVGRAKSPLGKIHLRVGEFARVVSLLKKRTSRDETVDQLPRFQ